MQYQKEYHDREFLFLASSVVLWGHNLRLRQHGTERHGPLRVSPASWVATQAPCLLDRKAQQTADEGSHLRVRFSLATELYSSAPDSISIAKHYVVIDAPTNPPLVRKAIRRSNSVSAPAVLR